MKAGHAVSRWLLISALLISGLLISAPLFASDRAAESAPLGRVDYLPYQVSVFVAFAPDVETTGAFRQSVCATLRTRLQQTFGATWILSPGADVVVDARLTPADAAGLERMSYASAAARLANVTCDKAYFLSVSRHGTQWQVAGREWDRTLQMLGAIASEQTDERRRVPDAALAVVMRLFSPLVIINDADRDSKSALLTVRAGSIPFGDPKFAPLRPGDILEPVFRFFDSKRNVRGIQSVPWTYLVLGADAIEYGQIKATVVSTYRAPLAANMRRRVEAVAFKVRRDFSSTRLKIVAGREPARPQGGLFVTIGELLPDRPAAPPAAAPKKEGETPAAPADKKEGEAPPSPGPPVLRLLSDRWGDVTIPVDPQHAIVRVEVHSGSAILARRPFVPGLEAEATLQVTDDHVRLGAEREIDILESQLIETVARRGAALAKTRAAISHSDPVAAQKTLADVERLPVADFYFGELNQIRVLALEEAHNRKDRVAERRIEDLCAKTLERITQYLPDDRIAAFKEEVANLVKSKAVTAAEAQSPLRRKDAPAPPTDVAPLRRGAPKKTQPLKRETHEGRPQPAGI
jgi:hypothetical protein